MSDTLTEADVARITGKTRPASQAAVLAKRGVPFTFLGSSVRVVRAVAEAHALLPQAKPAGVDFSRVR